MLKQVQSDLLLSKAAVLVHGCAPNDPFARDLVPSLREQWPAHYKNFRHYCQTYHPKPGALWAWVAAGSKRIVSLFTQPAIERHHGGKPGHAWPSAWAASVYRCIRTGVIETRPASLRACPRQPLTGRHA